MFGLFKKPVTFVGKCSEKIIRTNGVTGNKSEVTIIYCLYEQGNKRWFTHEHNSAENSDMLKNAYKVPSVYINYIYPWTMGEPMGDDFLNILQPTPKLKLAIDTQKYNFKCVIDLGEKYQDTRDELIKYLVNKKWDFTFGNLYSIEKDSKKKNCLNVYLNDENHVLELKLTWKFLSLHTKHPLTSKFE